MKKVILFLFSVAMIATSCSETKAETMVLDIDMGSKGAEVPASMYGIFFEEINHAGDGGLYGEMLMNRSFEERVLPKGGYKVENGELVSPAVMNHLAHRPTNGKFKWGTDPHPGWSLEKGAQGDAIIKVDNKAPKWDSAPNYMQVDIKAGAVSLVNSGYWGIALKKDETYKLRVIAQCSASYTGQMTVRLVGAQGKVLAQKKIDVKNGGAWNDYNEELVASDTTTVGKLYIDMNGAGQVKFDYVSLFPTKTFKVRTNGMREDIAQTLNDMRPAFIRWPGGCIVEGISLSNRVEWKKTLGDPASRGGEYDTWGYHNTYGFGYKEFLDFCEDTGAKGMYVCNVGMGCQARCGDVCEEHDIKIYVEDALDAIEYAIGDATTKWGSVRVAEGHSAPYPLTYVEIGNENSGPVYDKRHDIFYKAIKAKYPQLILISNHGLGDGYKNVEKVDMIDPHWYEDATFFYKNHHLFDDVKRNGYQIYVGEYACNRGVGGGNMDGALSEAAFIAGMERNSDLVTMASYAPLLENVNDRGWPTNLILFNNHQVLPRSSYFVQKMFAQNMPTHNLNYTMVAQPEVAEPIIDGAGYIGFGTWATQSQFKDVKITKPDGTVVTPNMSDPSQWSKGKGTWELRDGAQTQTSNENLTSLVWNKEKFEECTIEFKARKVSGQEGFMLLFGLEKPNTSKGLLLNIAGWGNGSSAFQTVRDGGTSTVSDMVTDRVQTDKWYDVKVVITKMEAQYFIDGKSVVAYQGNPIPKIFSVAGFDKTTNEVVVKVVNARGESCVSTINLAGGKVEKNGRVITLSSTSAQEENTFDNPKKIYPIESSFGKFSTSFKYEFKPYSMTILRIKRK